MLSVVLAIAMDPTTRRASAAGDGSFDDDDMGSPASSPKKGLEMKDVEIVSSS